MRAGFSRKDITPVGPVWMDGMIRAHRSAGVHDRIYAKALVLSPDADLRNACAIVSADVCGLSSDDCRKARAMIHEQMGIPHDSVIIAAVHNHSGPATVGFHNQREDEYTGRLLGVIASLVREAASKMEPASVGCGAGEERTISHYRRLLADDGHVVMNWEPWPAERIVRALGVIDPCVTVLKAAAAGDKSRLVGLLFNHAGHPNVMSGDNYLITSDYPGLAEAVLESELGGTAMFVNGAQGTMDIDGLKDRDWPGVERVGRALAAAVKSTTSAIVPRADAALDMGAINYTIPPRRIADVEKAWAENVMAGTGGAIQPVMDGVGDDYKASLLLELREIQDRPVEIEQNCIAIDDCAFISFPGEIFTEIGMKIKAASPFRHTAIIGLANGYAGYVPTREAIAQGGYEPDVRRMDDSAGDIVVEQSLALLQRVREQSMQKNR